MKKKNRFNSYVSNNPMLDAMDTVELPIIGAESYDAPLPYTRSQPHIRIGVGMNHVKYPVTEKGQEYDVPPAIFNGEKTEKNNNLKNSDA